MSTSFPYVFHISIEGEVVCKLTICLWPAAATMHVCVCMGGGGGGGV